MGLLNPVYLLAVPFLFLFTIPLAIFAGITTTLALMVLMFRVFLVYLDVALSLIPEFLTARRRNRYVHLEASGHHRASRAGIRDLDLQLSIPPTSSGGNASEHRSPSRSPLRSGYTTPGLTMRSHRRQNSYGFTVPPLTHHRSRSRASAGSVGTITPIHEDEVMLSADVAATPSSGLDRDFEGIGGWRLDDRPEEEDDWTNINSRLELPGEKASMSPHRSRSVGNLTPGERPSWMMPLGNGSRTGSHSPEEGQPSPFTGRKLNRSMRQLPSAPAAFDMEHGYFPKMMFPTSKGGSSRDVS